MNYQDMGDHKRALSSTEYLHLLAYLCPRDGKHICDAMGASTNLYNQCVPIAVCILDLAPRNAQRNDQHTDDQIVDA